MNVDFAAYQQAFTAALRRGDEPAARAVADRARVEGVEPGEIYLQIFAPGMVAIGDLWERNELSVAEEHMATAITERLVGELSPTFSRAAQDARATVLLGCVQGERHALGARMLADLFRRQGWRVLYLGADVPTADWVGLAARYHPHAVAISAGMASHLAEVRSLVAALRAELPAAFVLVGGAAFASRPDAWSDLGADLYHPDPSAAVAIATARLAGDSRPAAC
jgi:methanogenic corrinoid protein MtbC1